MVTGGRFSHYLPASCRSSDPGSAGDFRGDKRAGRDIAIPDDILSCEPIDAPVAVSGPEGDTDARVAGRSASDAARFPNLRIELPPERTGYSFTLT